MKNKIIKLLSMLMVLAMLVVMAGCANGGNTENSSTPTSSVNSDVTNSETDLDTSDEDEEDEEYNSYRILDGGYTELTPDNANMIIYNYMNLQAWEETSGGLAMADLGIVDKFELSEDEILKVNVSTYKKTNVKYAAYKAKMLTYMSEKRFKEFWDIEVQKDGYIYVSPGGLSGYSFSRFSTYFLKEKNGVYTYLTTCELDEVGYVGNCYIEANIIKENGMYVLDSYNYIKREDILFKGYDKLNDDIAKAIVYNYYNMLAHYYGSTEDYVDFFNLVNELKVDSKTTITVKNEEFDGVEFWKTNVKYKDFKNQLLKYVSKTKAEEFFDVFEQKDGYLYMYPCEGGGMYTDVLDAKLINEKNGKFIYKVTTLETFEDDSTEKSYVEATIIKQNGVYVLDSLTEIEDKTTDNKENSSNTNKKEEFYDDYEYCEILPKGECVEFSHRNVEDIVSKYLALKSSLDFKPDAFLACLGIVKDFKYSLDETIKVGKATLHRTNIKYSDYKNKMLTYMSEKQFNASDFSAKEIFSEKNGYLYTVDRKYGENIATSITPIFEKKDNNKYTYLTYCVTSSGGVVKSNCWFKVTVVKENGMYVLDSCKEVDRKKAVFKGYETLNDETALAIVDNYYYLLGDHSGANNYLSALNLTEKVEINRNEKIVLKNRELYKTNIKYNDFKNELLKYYSQDDLECYYLTVTGKFAEKDGYLYILDEGPYYFDLELSKIKFVKEENGKYYYELVGIENSGKANEYKFEIKVKIIKQNGVYVLDTLIEI